jgi:hypothetical protein
MTGAGFGITLFTVPAILYGGAPTDVMLRQWQLMFNKGKAMFPVFGAATALNYFYLAYRHRAQGLEWRGFAAGGVASVGIVPFTLLFIAGINSRLISAIDSKAAKDMSQDLAKELIKQWGSLNALRACIPLVGTCLAIWNFFA